jgi:hypothetical protein
MLDREGVLSLPGQAVIHQLDGVLTMLPAQVD